MLKTQQIFPVKTKMVHGAEMAYVEVGKGAPIVFLHGNPTSSFIWREIIPYVADLGRCLAPDLVGMGRSDKLPFSGPDRYTFVDHQRYLDGLLEAIDVRSEVILVVHDWGSALGFDWARRHPKAVRGIAYMEAIVRPLTWDEWPRDARSVFEFLRSDAGESMVLEKNLFVETILPAAVMRQLTEEEMEAYRMPFDEPGEGRRPTLTWPRQIPLDGEPADVAEVVRQYSDWLATSEVPKLFVNAEPGSILVGAQREHCRAWPNQREVTVPGIHFIQEDSPDQIGQALRSWIEEL